MDVGRATKACSVTAVLQKFRALLGRGPQKGACVVTGIRCRRCAGSHHAHGGIGTVGWVSPGQVGYDGFRVGNTVVGDGMAGTADYAVALVAAGHACEDTASPHCGPVHWR